MRYFIRLRDLSRCEIKQIAVDVKRNKLIFGV